jgi:hypothetical protein
MPASKHTSLTMLVTRCIVAALALAIQLPAHALQLFATHQPNPNTFQSVLYDVSVQTGQTTPLLNLGTSFYSALAFDQNRQLYGASSTLWTIDTETGSRVFVANLPAVMNSIAFLPDGRMVAFSPNALYTLERDSWTIESATFVSSPQNLFIQGGIAANGVGELLTIGLRATGSGIKSTLAGVDRITGEVTDLGDLTQIGANPLLIR